LLQGGNSAIVLQQEFIAMKYFNEEGRFLESTVEYIESIDDDEGISEEMYAEVIENYEKFSPKSNIVATYWIVDAAIATEKAYSDDLLLCRCLLPEWRDEQKKLGLVLIGDDEVAT
jgi:hypothetical protein